MLISGSSSTSRMVQPMRPVRCSIVFGVSAADDTRPLDAKDGAVFDVSSDCRLYVQGVKLMSGFEAQSDRGTPSVHADQAQARGLDSPAGNRMLRNR